MSSRKKMRGSLKKVGRCIVPGHGDSCEVTHEIRSSPITRAAEKRQVRREIERELE